MRADHHRPPIRQRLTGRARPLWPRATRPGAAGARRRSAKLGATLALPTSRANTTTSAGIGTETPSTHTSTWHASKSRSAPGRAVALVSPLRHCTAAATPSRCCCTVTADTLSIQTLAGTKDSRTVSGRAHWRCKSGATNETVRVAVGVGSDLVTFRDAGVAVMRTPAPAWLWRGTAGRGSSLITVARVGRGARRRSAAGAINIDLSGVVPAVSARVRQRADAEHGAAYVGGAPANRTRSLSWPTRVQ